jgi:VWFA-related protein
LRPISLPAAALASALSAAFELVAPPAAAQAPPVFGASADLVVIDLVATDGEGRLVTDLRAEELRVRDGGKPQRIESLRLVRRSPAPAPASTAPAAAAPEGPLLPEEPLSLVVVVDKGAMGLDVFARTRDAIVSMVGGGLPRGTRLMLVVLERGLRVAVPFTDDAQRFLGGVESLPPPVGEGEGSLAELLDRVDQVCDGSPGSVQSAIAIGLAWVEDARVGLSLTIDGLAALTRQLAVLPGRKHVVLYSVGYPMQPPASAADLVAGVCGGANDVNAALRAVSVDSHGMLRTLLDEATRAQVSVYTVDARGLTGDVPPARARVSSRSARGGLSQELLRRAAREPQEILGSIADGTGGRAALNTNELARGMRAAAADARGYYLLAYVPPPGRKEGRFYPLEVESTRPGVHLRYRRGYEWLSEAARAERAIAAAFRFPGLYAEEGVALEARIEEGRLVVVFFLPTAAMSFRNDGGVHRNAITLLGLLRDDQGRAVGKRYLFSKTIDLKLGEERYADLRSRDNVEIRNDAPAPKKGRYRVTVVARHSGDRLATATAETEAP